MTNHVQPRRARFRLLEHTGTILLSSTTQLQTIESGMYSLDSLKMFSIFTWVNPRFGIPWGIMSTLYGSCKKSTPPKRCNNGAARCNSCKTTPLLNTPVACWRCAPEGCEGKQNLAAVAERSPLEGNEVRFKADQPCISGTLHGKAFHYFLEKRTDVVDL